MWARLRIMEGVKVSRQQTLRVMRENDLFSPYRPSAKRASGPQGEIITPEPNRMGGTNGSEVLTVEES